jgi:ribosome recycling factor
MKNTKREVKTPQPKREERKEIIIEAWTYIQDGDFFVSGIGRLDIYQIKKQAKENSTENQREKAKLVKVFISIPQ